MNRKQKRLRAALAGQSGQNRRVRRGAQPAYRGILLDCGWVKTILRGCLGHIALLPAGRDPAFQGVFAQLIR
jgi:hypothetical protein